MSGMTKQVAINLLQSYRPQCPLCKLNAPRLLIRYRKEITMHDHGFEIPDRRYTFKDVKNKILNDAERILRSYTGEEKHI